MLINLEDHQLLTIFVVSSVVILGASEIGHLFGGRAVPRTHALSIRKCWFTGGAGAKNERSDNRGSA